MTGWLASTLMLALSVPQAGGGVIGLGRNSHGTIDVGTPPCGDGICGVVVSASPAAIADARESGVDTLLGLQLLSGYHRVGPNRWAGQVFVPDMGRRFSSRIEQTGPNSLKLSGCLVGGWGCRSQQWTRV